jgi:hypothetical protein
MASRNGKRAENFFLMLENDSIQWRRAGMRPVLAELTSQASRALLTVSSNDLFSGSSSATKPHAFSLEIKLIPIRDSRVVFEIPDQVKRVPRP